MASDRNANGSARSAESKHQHRWELFAIPIGAVILATSGYFAFRGLSGFESRLFTTLNSAPRWLDNALWPIMQCGTILMAPVVAIVVAVRSRASRVGTVGGQAADRRAAGKIAALSAVAAATVLAAWYFAIVTKKIVERGRPASYRLGVDVFGEAATGFGYVSGHTTVAFAAALVLGRGASLRARVLLLIGAGIVGLSRIVVGSHLPLDVVGGAGLGLICGGVGSLVLDLIDRVRSGDGV